LAGWLAVLVFLNWQPFDFTAGLAPPRLRTLSLIPFADTLEGNYLHGFENLAQKAALFLPVGALLAPTHLSRGHKMSGALAVLGALALAAGLEAGQLFLPTRFASVTDVLVETAGAWAGFALTRRMREASRAALLS
jgi:glycopeptide antibiotics resistance protein